LALQSIEIALDISGRNRFERLPATLQGAEEASYSSYIVPSNPAAVAFFSQVCPETGQLGLQGRFRSGHDDLLG
jgi:hypothetical protein